VNRTTLAPVGVQVQLEEGAQIFSNALLALMYLGVAENLRPTAPQLIPARISC
jgi:hypothetical protein